MMTGRQWKQRWAAGAAIGLLLLGIGLALAAGELLPRSQVSGGGGAVASGGLALHTAVGQPAAGAVTMAGATLCSGFWCGLGAPGGPLLGEMRVYLPVVIRP